MKTAPKEQRCDALAMSIARGLAAAIVAFSFLAFLLPLGSASAGRTGLMACCIGKPGHESGSCSTGLIDRRPQSESKTSSSQKAAPAKKLSIDIAKVKGGARSGEHCSLHTQSAENTESLIETSGPESVSTETEAGDLVVASLETSELKPEPATATTEQIGTGSIDALSSPCPMECGTCSVNYTRRPRPRDQSTLSFLPKHPLPSGRRFSTGVRQQVRTLHAKFLQVHPRAPPASLL